MDLNGTSRRHLIQHLKNVKNFHTVPTAMLLVGIMFLGVAYAVDGGMRVGCFMFYYGIACVPCVLSLIFAMVSVLKNKRAQLLGGFKHASLFATWKDVLNVDYPASSEETPVDNKLKTKTTPSYLQGMVELE